MNTPKYSVVVPIHNIDEQYLKKCVESILGQTLPDLELILVDDGSTDELRVHRVVCVQNKSCPRKHKWGGLLLREFGQRRRREIPFRHGFARTNLPLK